MRVTLDSNVWEKIFDPADHSWRLVRGAFASGTCHGFICETGLKIEAIRKSDRTSYFAQPAMSVQSPFDVMWKDGRPYVRFMSIGPDDNRHPGLPEIQSQKLKAAFGAGIQLLRGSAWLGLPGPVDIQNPDLFAAPTNIKSGRELRQINVQALIEHRGVGKAVFDAVGGWQVADKKTAGDKVFQKACAEWADAEMVAAHIAYENDVLCTNDYGRGAGVSILDEINRAWLSAKFQVRFMSLEELCAHVLDES